MITGQKETECPTMDEKTPPPTSKEEDKLYQQYKSLEREWDNMQESSKPRTKTLQKSSTDTTTMVKALQLLDSSPRNLMSSLQERSKSRSPLVGRGTWKIRTNDLAVEEILRERRAAIESGKLKGRRLFEDLDGVSDMGFGAREEIVCSAWNGWGQESEVRSVCSYGDKDYETVETKEGLHRSPHCYSTSSSLSSSSPSDSSFVCEDCMGRDVVVASFDKDKKKGVIGYRKRWIFKLMGWLIIGLFVCAIAIISMRSSDDRNPYEVILVPT